MDDIKQEDLTEKKPLPSEGENEAEEKTEAEQDPLKTELEKVQKKEGGRTKKEKLIYTKKRVEEQLRELDKEEGVETIVDEDDEDDKPLTKGEFKRLEAERVAKSATKTALDLADGIENETEKELTKYHLNNTIKSTGNPNEDLKLARAIVNSAKNAQIAEEVARKSKPKSHSSQAGYPAKQEDDEEELTAEEMTFMRPPLNLSREDVIKARKGGKARFDR